MNNINAKNTVTIPVPINYVSDMMIAGVSKKDIRMLKFGDACLEVFFTEVPAYQAKEILKFTWAEVNFDKATRRRNEKGLVDCGLEDVENYVEEAWVEDPFFNVIQMEIADEQEKLIAYLEGKHKHFGEIYRERLNGNFCFREMERKIGVNKTSISRWNDEVTLLAAKYYFKKYF